MQNKLLLKKGLSFVIIVFIVVNLFYFCFQVIALKRTAIAHGIRLRSKYKYQNLKIIKLAPDEWNNEQKHLIVLRLLKNECHQCMDSIFANTLRLTKTYGKQSVIVLVNNDYNYHDYLTLKRLYQYDLNLYQQKDNLTTLDDRGNSYYFLFDKNKPAVAQHAYILYDAPFAGHTPQYYDWISKVNASRWIKPNTIAINNKLIH